MKIISEAERLNPILHTDGIQEIRYRCESDRIPRYFWGIKGIPICGNNLERILLGISIRSFNFKAFSIWVPFDNLLPTSPCENIPGLS